mmetsp:Transcript_18114/g.20892  ORF Transcript_18114/g.20892 Transcript_18114/m.20892 type:complete len:242 (-) Transcript_18114:507-1232(-)
MNTPADMPVVLHHSKQQLQLQQTPSVLETSTTIAQNIVSAVPNNNAPLDPILVLTNVISSALKKKELLLPRFIQGKTDFYQWRNDALKLMLSNESFRPYAETVDNNLSLLSSLPLDKCTELSVAFSKALDQKAKTESGLDTSSSVDGYSDWQLLSETLGQQIHSTLDKQDMITTLINIRRQPKESISDFKSKYYKQLNICKYNNIFPFNDKHLLYISYLRSLNHTVLSSIILYMDTRTMDG